MSEDRNQQALNLLTQPGYRVVEWAHGFSVLKGAIEPAYFFNRTELELATIRRLQAVATKPGHNPTRPKPRRYVSRRRSSATAGLALAYGAMAEMVERANGQPGPMTWDELEQEKLNFAARVEAARKGQ